MEAQLSQQLALQAKSAKEVFVLNAKLEAERRVKARRRSETWSETGRGQEVRVEVVDMLLI